MDYVDESISDINGGDSFEPEDYKDYKSEVLWKTLGSLEFDNDREVDDVEEFFKYMNKKVFNDKIKQGYLNFKKWPFSGIYNKTIFIWTPPIQRGFFISYMLTPIYKITPIQRKKFLEKFWHIGDYVLLLYSNHKNIKT